MKTDEKDPQRGNKSKIVTYGWTIKDDKPGELKYINKTLLEVDHDYQRSYDVMKARALASDWSWCACGVITVSRRPTGEFFIIDGQHRVLAALKRDDIIDLPCVIFEIDSVKTEAQRFIDSNTRRKNVSSLSKFHAEIMAENEVAIYLANILNTVGITVTKSKTALSLQSVTACKMMIKEDKVAFEKTIHLIAELCKDYPIPESILSGTFYLARHLNTDITNDRLKRRILTVGFPLLKKATFDAAAYYSRGGAKVWATGMRDEINKGLRNKFEFRE